MRFVDLFAGLGGFHLALKELGHECVFACEIDETLRELYKKNFGLDASGDLRAIDAADIPAHDILCAGFPCQPFSKAGSQPGLEHPEHGGLYLDILRVIRHHKPRYLILENVPNLEMHAKGKTWGTIESRLRDEGYDVKHERLSPHSYGIPQIRDRIYIVGSLGSLDGFDWPKATSTTKTVSIADVLDTNPAGARSISEQVKRCLSVWQAFLDQFPTDKKIPHPLWSMEFGATYPYEETTPSQMCFEELRRYRGSYGCSLAEAETKEALLDLLPSHARRIERYFPDWKVRFIRLNRDFYANNKDWLDRWIPKIREFPSSFQKLEWNCQGEKDRVLSHYVIQIRPSGVRVKRPTTAPSLVAMTTTQVPLIGWESRYMTPTECKRLQSMDSLKHLPENSDKAYQALGNAVNVKVARLVASALLGTAVHHALPDDSSPVAVASGS